MCVFLRFGRFFTVVQRRVRTIFSKTLKQCGPINYHDCPHVLRIYQKPMLCLLATQKWPSTFFCWDVLKLQFGSVKCISLCLSAATFTNFVKLFVHPFCQEKIHMFDQSQQKTIFLKTNAKRVSTKFYFRNQVNFNLTDFTMLSHTLLFLSFSSLNCPNKIGSFWYFSL